MRYFEGTAPDELRFGTPWPSANFIWVDSLTEVAAGVAVISTVSTTPGTLELHELSLAIRTPAGLLLVVGCSHPGIEKILEAARPFGDHVHLIFGGLHLVTAPDTTIAHIASALRGRWKLDQIAPGHCTGEPAFAELRRVFAQNYLFAGLGTVAPLP
jgi:7,8-dihydropterin-6-yl-methyl-4-(beta-D-ribofuranosyl)aminobenzene 5'-phosphate synthase